MIPGTILFDPSFQFKDGELGKKIFIVLNEGSDGIYVTAKTTSRGSRFGIQHGCQIMDRYPNFQLTKGCCCLEKLTWIQLDTFYDFQSNKLFEKVLTSQIHRIGVLSDELTLELLICVSNAEDLTRSQESKIQFTLKEIQKKQIC